MTEQQKMKFYTVQQVSDLLQIHYSTITKWLREGYIKGYKSGKQWRISQADLDEWLEEHANRKEA